jgi:hypothetical protein
MSKKPDLNNDQHHRELIAEMKEAESRFKKGYEKEDHVVSALTPRISSAIGLGWIARKIGKRVIPVVLRVGIRAVVTVLNEILGKEWLEEFGKERKKF